jgi:hypothetical protein
MKAVRNWYELTDISNYFTEEFFATKKILYIPLK